MGRGENSGTTSASTVTDVTGVNGATGFTGGDDPDAHDDPGSARGEGHDAWQIGAVIHDRWEVFGIGRELRNPKAPVYLVRDREWGKLELAVRSLPRSWLDPEGRARRWFEDETRRWRDVGTHPHLVAGAYTLALDDELRFFTQYFPGQPLARVLEELDSSPVTRRFDLAVQLISGLAALHVRGHSHGCLDSASVVVASDDSLALAFALAGCPGVGKEPITARSATADIAAAGQLLSTILRGVADADGKLAALQARLAGPTERRPDARELLARLLSLCVELTGTAYGRPEAPPESTELGEAFRGASYAAMDDLASAKEILARGKRRVLGICDLNLRLVQINEGADLAGLLTDVLRAPRSDWVKAHLDRLRDQIAPELFECEAPVTAVATTQDGRFVATGSDKADETARLWDATTGTHLVTLRWTRDPTTALAYAPDGATLVSGSEHGSVRLWDANTGSLIRALEGHTSKINAIAWHATQPLLATASRDETARLWESGSGRPLRVLKGHGGAILSVAFHPKGGMVVTGGVDGCARLWDVAGTNPLFAMAQGSPVTDIVAQLDVIYTAGIDGRVRFWDLSGNLVQVLDLPRRPAITSMALSSTGRSLVVGASDGKTYVIDPERRRLARELGGHRSEVTAVAFVGVMHILTGGSDGTVRRWRSANPVPRQPPLRLFIPRFPNAPRSDVSSNATVGTKTGPSPDALLATLRNGVPSAYAELRALNTRDADSRFTALINEASAAHGVRAGVRGCYESDRIPLNSAAKRVAVASGRILSAGAAIELRDIRGKLLTTFPHGRDRHPVTALRPDARMVAISNGNALQLWDTARVVLVQSLDHPDAVTAVHFSPDSRTVLTGAADGVARLWDVTSYRVMGTYTGHAQPIRAVAISADNRLAVTGCDGGAVRIWDRMTGDGLGTLAGHDGPVAALAITSEGRTVASGGDDLVVRLSPTSGAPGLTLPHPAPVSAVAITPDDRYLLTACGAAGVRVFECATGNPIYTIDAHPNEAAHAFTV